MKVALVNTYDVKDIKIWASIPYYVSLMLEKMFDDVSYVQIPLKRNLASYIKGFYFNRIRGKKYLAWADRSVIRINNKAYEKALEQDFDLIITFQFFLVPLLKKRNSKVLWWSDATFNNLLNNYSYVTNVSSYCTNEGHIIQKNALDQSDAVVLVSDWATNSALRDYGADIRKIRQIPFASHLSLLPTNDEVEEIIFNKQKSVIKLLFIGIDWDRKGGDDAVAVVDALNRKGHNTILYVVGSQLPAKYRNNKDIIGVGFVDKSSATGEKEIIDLIKESSFLILPSRAECFGIVFCEANSFALPVITTNVGGIPSAVKGGVNGSSFPLNEFVTNATEFIVNNLPTTEQYKELCYNSYHFYKEEMSWERLEEKFTGTFNQLFPDQELQFAVP